MQEFQEDVRILRLLKPRLPERPVMLDIGLSNGRWIREIVKVSPGATVFLFEPGSAYTAEMQASLGNAIPNGYRCALSDRCMLRERNFA